MIERRKQRRISLSGSDIADEEISELDDDTLYNINSARERTQNAHEEFYVHKTFIRKHKPHAQIPASYADMCVCVHETQTTRERERGEGRRRRRTTKGGRERDRANKRTQSTT